MELLFQLLKESWVVMAAQLGVGKVLKGNQAIPNAIINFANFLVAVFGGLVLPATAQAAGVLGGPLGVGLGVFATAALQQVFTTGVHSTFKNTVLPAAKVSLLWFVDKFVRKGE